MKTKSLPRMRANLPRMRTSQGNVSQKRLTITPYAYQSGHFATTHYPVCGHLIVYHGVVVGLPH